MKLRIKGNSIRIRLSRSEVGKLCTNGHLEETTAFGIAVFTYALSTKTATDKLSAEYNANTMHVFIPATWIKGWETNDTVGFDSTIRLTESETLYLLVEKDFQCLDHTTEDQSDNYINPNKTC